MFDSSSSVTVFDVNVELLGFQGSKTQVDRPMRPLVSVKDAEMGPVCEYVIVHTILGGSPVILWISLGGKLKWLTLKFGYHDVMRTSPLTNSSTTTLNNRYSNPTLALSLMSVPLLAVLCQLPTFRCLELVS